MMSPLLSIIIPSKNRSIYALSSVKSILSIKDESLEVLVHDNSDDDSLGKSLEVQINDSRLRYVYDPSPMPILWNFEKAMDQSRGKYVCFIGDDDSVNHQIMDAVKWANDRDLDAITGKLVAAYRWPKESAPGKLVVYPFTGKWRYYNPEDELKKFVKNGSTYYLEHDFPKAYHGIVKRQCVKKIKDISGSYFGGLTPDSFSAIALASVVKKAVTINYPLTLSGTSPPSDETHRTEEAKVRSLSESPQLKGRQDYQWSHLVPKLYSRETMWAESSVAAFSATFRLDLIGNINKLRMMAIMANGSPHYFKEISEHYRSINNKEISEVSANNSIKLESYKLLLESLFLRFMNRISKFSRGMRTFEYQGFSDLEDANKRVNICLNENYDSLKNYLSR